MYIRKANQLLLAVFYNTQLKPHHKAWLPCEIEALVIGSALHHFAPYLIQSHKGLHMGPNN